MKHPILSGFGYKLYTLVWLVVILAHGSVLYFYYDFPAPIAIADSLTFNLIFGVIAPSLWFIVTFGGINKDELSLVSTHIGAAFLTIVVWLSLSNYILRLLFQNQVTYINFLVDSRIWRMIVGVLFYSISVLIFYLIRYYRDMQERLKKELELQNLLKDSELRMLKSQINPHFIFNSLNSVSALTVSKPEDAREMVVKLSDFLRYSLGKENSELNSLEQEIKNVSLYLDIEKVRFGEKLKFEKQISKDCLTEKVPNLILQPLLENAIKYGVYDSIEPVTIHLTCEKLNGMVQVHIKNNFDPTSVTAKGEGIGLANVRKRLNLVYGRSDLLHIEHGETDFLVTLKIPTYTTIDESN